MNRIVTVVGYPRSAGPGAYTPEDPEATMKRLFDALRGSGFETTGSFTRFDARDPIQGATFVVEVQNTADVR